MDTTDVRRTTDRRHKERRGRVRADGRPERSGGGFGTGIAAEAAAKKLQQDKKRIQLDFAPPAYDRLLEIKDHLGETTITGVFRLSLLILDWYLVRRHRNWRLQWVTDEGKTVDVPDLVFAATSRDPLPAQQ